VAAPAIDLTLVGHFLRADFGRIHGQVFLHELRHPYYHDQDRRLVMRSRKVVQFVELSRYRTVINPILGYLFLGEDLYEVRVQVRDTLLPYGADSLNNLAQTFLGLPKCQALSDHDKQDMLNTFKARPGDAFGYGLVDAVSTLLVHEQMEVRDKAIYQAFGVPATETPPLRATLGSRVATFMVATALRTVAAGSERLPGKRALQALMAGGGLALFREHPGASRFGAQTGRVHGGLLYSRSATRFWHASPGALRDVDMAGCYNNILTRMNVYMGRPVIYEPGQARLSLGQAVALLRQHAAPDGWMVRVSGDVTGPNALIPSSDDAVTSANYRRKLAPGKRRRARRRAFHLEELADPGSVKGTVGSRLYAARVESGVVTAATWLMIRAMPEALRRQYEELTADSLVFYPQPLVANSGAEYDALVERYENEALPWESALDLQAMELLHREKIDAQYVSLRYPIGDYARKIGEFREEAQRTEGKKSGADRAWKVHANTMFGVLASSYLPTNNFVAGNQVTARARAEAFGLGQALNAIQTITDGCTFRVDQIPACTYADCLRIMPDYPIRRAEDGGGVPFLDPATIPQDDAGFTAWYRRHVMWFFGVSGAEYDEFFSTHALEHKKTSVTKSVAFDALGCDGSGNYMKCTRDGAGNWLVEDFAARSYGKKSKEVIKDWIVRTYSTDNLTELAPVAEDTQLLSLKQASQKARAALDAGIPEVYYPLGLEYVKVMNYRALKPSGFIFQTPEQRTAVVRRWQKFEDKTGAGLEALALRRTYKGRRRGSLTALAEQLYRLIRSGEDNLRTLNLSRIEGSVLAVTGPRAQDIERRKAVAEARLREMIDTRHLCPAGLPTAYLVNSDQMYTFDLPPDQAPAPAAPVCTNGQTTWPFWPVPAEPVRPVEGPPSS
jgi:hypothetical protein